MTWNWRWPWATKRPASRRLVILYTRAGCHLCDDALEALASARKRYEFEWRTVDVDDDPALAELYGLSVPVVEIDGRVRFRGRVNRALLARILAASPSYGAGG